MHPKDRAAAAVSAGKYPSIEHWCSAVCVSTDPRVPEAWKAWAKQQLEASLGKRAWIWLIAAKRDAGHKLAEAQTRALKELYDERGTTETSEESRS